MNYYEYSGEFINLPQWAKNRLTYQEDKKLYETLIQENKTWIEFYRIRNQISNCVLHQERILYYEKLLSELDAGTEYA